MVKSGFRWLLLAAALAAVGGLVYYLNRPRPVAVVVAVVSRGPVQDTVANTRAGTVKAQRRASLSPAVGGQIQQLPVHKGERVEAGQLLMELWNDDLRARVELAREEQRSAAARAREACVVADVARQDAQRLEKLFEKGVASDEQRDDAVGQAQSKSAACEAAQARIAVSKAQVAVAQATLDKTRLVAPFAGTVAEINGEVGEFVTPSPIGIPTPPAVDLVDLERLYVSAPIDEVDAPAIRTGMTARISLDAFRDRRFAGHVSRVASYVLDREKQARTVEVEVDFDDPADSAGLLPGYSADIEVVLAERRDVLRVPTEAVLEGNRVLVFDAAGGRLQARDIHVGLHNWQYTEVLSGLRAGDRVVTSVDREGVQAGAPAVIEKTAGADD